MENISHIGYTEEKVSTNSYLSVHWIMLKIWLGLVFVFLTQFTKHGVQFLNCSYSLFS